MPLKSLGLKEFCPNDAFDYWRDILDALAVAPTFFAFSAMIYFFIVSLRFSCNSS